MVDSAGTSNDSHPYHEMIQQFKEICAVSDEIAQMCIEEAEGNLQNAIVRYINNGTSELDRQPVSPESVLRQRRREFGEQSSQSSSTSTDSSVPYVGAPVRRQPLYVADNSWFGWLRRLFSAPVYFFYYSVRQVFAFVFGLFGGFLPALTSPEEDVQTFKEEIDTKYNDVGIALPWNHSTYAQALDQAKSSVRFLVVYLHNPSHQGTEDFVRNVLYTPQFKDLLERNRTLLWGANVKTREGHMVTQALKVITYPCVAIICMRERSLSCVARVCGITALAPLVDNLQQAMSGNERFLNQVLNERAQREMDTRLRREQEEEYRRALEVDRKNVAERRRLESEKIETQMKEEEAQRQLEERIRRFQEMRSQIKSEMSVLPEPTASVVRVSIRFPSGGSLERKFSENDSLELLFKAALSDDKCPSDFTLLSRFPNKTLNCSPDWYKEFGTVDDGNNPNQTFKEAGLVSSVVILVRDNQA